jgi:diaminopimelate epimerase
MRFEKYQALGNDFLIVRQRDTPSTGTSDSSFFRFLCDRRFGPGADGVEVILDQVPDDADFAVRLYNADGGETPISGNGTRCVAAYLYFNELWREPRVNIATGAGVKHLSLIERETSRFVFAAEMGRPRLASTEIPIAIDPQQEPVVGARIALDGRYFDFTATSMGNPHCSIFVENFDAIDWRRIGAAIERHPIFPERTNVEFIRVIDRENIEVRFWERGVGETLASGTGACGAAIAAMLNEKTERNINVLTAAGKLEVGWRADGEVIQTGEARPVYRGQLIV